VAQCQVAALAFWLSYSGVYDDEDFPKGCFLRNETGDEAVYFNPDTTGGLDAASQPLCTTMSTAAPTTAPPTTAAPVTPSPSFRGPLSGSPDSGIPILASATSEIDPTPQAPPSRHAHARTALTPTRLQPRTHAHAHGDRRLCSLLSLMLARADAAPRPHGLACTCRIGSALHPPNRSVHVVPRSTSGIGQRAPAAGSITQSGTLWVTAGYGSTLALQATWSRSRSARCCGAAQLTAPARSARSRVRPLLPRLRGSTCHIGTGTGLTPPTSAPGLGSTCHIGTGTGADRHATRRA
jgi:hypothetical protein